MHPMICLSEKATDISMVIRSLQTARDASRTFPAVLSGLSGILTRVKAQRPSQRRNGDLDSAIDWCRRSVFDSRVLSDGQKELAESVILELKRLVAAPVADWRPVEPKRAAVR
jgi:hypothetical protein